MGTLIGYAAAPLPPDALRQWITSFRQLCPKHRVILLADPAEAYASLHDFFDVEVVPANLHNNPFDVPDGSEKFRGCVSVYKDRWTAVSKLNLPDDELVLLTDTRDVVFQRDPFQPIEGIDGILAAGEGEKFKHNHWNRAQLDRHFPEYRAVMAEHETICAGVIAGPFYKVRTMAKEILELLGDKTGMAEQCALNIVLRHSNSFEAYTVHYEQGWCIHCASMISPWGLDRAKRLPKIQPMPLLLSSGHLTTQLEIPFAIVHHWPMVPQLSHFKDLGRD